MSLYNTLTYYYYPSHVSETFIDNYCYITSTRITKPRPAIYPSYIDPAATALLYKDKRFNIISLYFISFYRPHRYNKKSVPDIFNTYISHYKIHYNSFTTYRADSTLYNHYDSYAHSLSCYNSGERVYIKVLIT